MIKIIGYLFNIKAEIKIQVRENDMRAVEVRLQNASMQAGLEKNPVIQWQYGEEDAGKRQSSYQIQILNEKGEICADTGEINSSEQNNIEIPMELKSLHGYEIQVKV